MDAFTKNLLWLSTQIVSEDDCDCLRFIASLVLKRNQQHKNVKEILEQLEEKYLLSKNNIHIVYEALTLMNQLKLRSEFLKKFGFLNYKPKPSVISSFTRLLVSVRHTLGKDELSNLIFFYKKGEGAGIIEYKNSAYAVLLYLWDKLLLTNDVESLKKFAGVLEVAKSNKGQRCVEEYLKHNPNLSERAESQSTLEDLSPVEDTDGCLQGFSSNITGNGNTIVIGTKNLIINKSLGISEEQPVVNKLLTSDQTPAMNQQLKTDYQRATEETAAMHKVLTSDRRPAMNQQLKTEYQRAMEETAAMNKLLTPDQRPPMNQQLKTDYQRTMEETAAVNKLLSSDRRSAMNQQLATDYQLPLEQAAMNQLTSDVEHLSAMNKQQGVNQQPATVLQLAIEKQPVVNQQLTSDLGPAMNQQLKADYQQGMEEKAAVNQQSETEEKPEMVQQLAIDQNSASGQILTMNQQPTTDYQLLMYQQPSVNKQQANEKLPEKNQQSASDHQPSTMEDTGQPKHFLVSDSRDTSPPAVMSPPKSLSSFSFTQPSSIPPGLRQGTWCKQKGCYLFQKYEIETMTRQVIGRGGFGIVYKGVWIRESGEDHLEVAVKVYDKEIAQKSGQGTKQFQKELDAVGISQHCFAVTVLGYCHDEEYKALVYPYMEKGDLKAMIDNHSCDMTWQIRLRILHQICRTMCHFHNSFKSRDGVSIVHGDVKANNIFLDKHLNAFLGDFGVIKELPENVTSITELDKPSVLGYDDSDAVKHLSYSSDVYMFGVVIYRCLTSKPAQQGNDPAICKSLMSYRKGDFEASYDELYELVDRDIWTDDKDEVVKEVTELAIRCFIKKNNKVKKERCTFKEILEKLDCLMKKNKIKEYEKNADIRCICCQINQPVEASYPECQCTRVMCHSCLQKKDLPCPFHVSSKIREHFTN